MTNFTRSPIPISRVFASRDAEPVGALLDTRVDSGPPTVAGGADWDLRSYRSVTMMEECSHSARTLTRYV